MRDLLACLGGAVVIIYLFAFIDWLAPIVSPVLGPAFLLGLIGACIYGIAKIYKLAKQEN